MREKNGIFVCLNTCASGERSRLSVGRTHDHLILLYHDLQHAHKRIVEFNAAVVLLFFNCFFFTLRGNKKANRRWLWFSILIGGDRRMYGGPIGEDPTVRGSVSAGFMGNMCVCVWM